jgi:alpha-galactosidase
MVRMKFHINQENEIRLIDFCGLCLEKENNECLLSKSYLVELQISGGEIYGHRGARYTSTSEVSTLKYLEHSILTEDNKKILKIVQRNLNFEVKTFYEVFNGTNTLRSYSEIKNISKEKICVEHVSSFVLYGVFGDKPYEYLDYFIPTNSWHCECQWRKVRLMIQPFIYVT